MVGAATSSEFHSEWNREGLKTQLVAMVPTLTTADLSVIDDARDPAALESTLVDLVQEHYAAKQREVGEEGLPVLERLVLLRVIDSLWVEHLTAVDDMRRGIGLRAYSQREPLNEFKIEAYRMFDELKSTIRHDVTHTIFRVTVVQPPAQPVRRMTESRPDVTGDGSNGAAPGVTTTTSGPVGATVAAGVGAAAGASAAGARSPKIGRNDPCWCGSGKKYKKCHGA